MADRTPIVFLPGVMGSRLYFPGPGLFWDPDSTWRMLRWAPLLRRTDDDNRRDLHAREPAGVVIDAPNRGVTDDEVALGWGGVVWSFYGDYLRLLRGLAAGGKAFALGYDWRQDIRWLGEYAADKMWAALDATGADRLAVVTHSMGGLVARAALRHDPSLVARVAKLVHVCQPAAGAVILYRRLFTGLVRGLDGGGGVSDRAFRLLLGNTRAAFVANMSGQPGPLQLLPSRYFPADAERHAWNEDIDAGTAPTDLYGGAHSPPGLSDPGLGLTDEVLADLAERVQDIADFHGWLDAPPAPPDPPDTWVICGVGTRTEVRIGFPGGQAQPTVTGDGDGVVPVLSATVIGTQDGRLFRVDGLEHATACANGRVAELTNTILGQ
jgi:hypothetical protein